MGRMLCVSLCSFLLVCCVWLSALSTSLVALLFVSFNAWCVSLSVIMVWTSCCCALLCRSCMTCWCLSLVVAISCVRDAVSVLCAAMLEIVVVISLVNCSSRVLVVGGSGGPCERVTIAFYSALLVTIGMLTPLRMSRLCVCLVIVLVVIW